MTGGLAHGPSAVSAIGAYLAVVSRRRIPAAGVTWVRNPGEGLQHPWRVLFRQRQDALLHRSRLLRDKTPLLDSLRTGYL